MRLVFRYITFIVSLLLVEYVGMFLCFLVHNLILYQFRVLLITGALKDASDVNMLRLVFYWPFYILGFVYFTKRLSKDSGVLSIMIINCGLYLGISMLFGFILIPGTKEYFLQSFFYFFIIVTFLSPFILNKIPYYKKLIANLKGASPSVAVDSQEEEVVYELGVGEKKITLFIVFKYLLFTLSLFVVGALVFTALAMCFFHKQPFKLQYMWDMVLFCMQFSATKLLLYYPLQFIPLVCLMSEIVGRYRVLKLALINGGLYIVVSLVYALILKPDTRVYFLEGFYYIFILAMFISPVLLIRVPYFKQLARSLEQPHAPHMFKRMLDFVLSIK